MDSLRGLAAMSIVLYHAVGYGSGLDGVAFFSPIFGRLEVGVPIFFVISGFLLYRPFVRARRAGDTRPRIGPYAWRRVLRIIPGYWAALTIVGLALGFSYLFTVEGVLRYYGFAQMYTVDSLFRGIVPAWTLGIEIAFYAILPVYAIAIGVAGRWTGRRWFMATEIAGLAVLYVIAISWQISAYPPGVTTRQLWLPGQLDHFALGMGLAVASVHFQGGARMPRPLRLIERRPLIAWLAALGALLTAAYGLGFTGLAFEAPASLFSALALHQLYGIVALSMALPAVFGAPTRGAVRRLLGHPALLWLGMISYGVYLWHVPVLQFAFEHEYGNFPGIHPYMEWIAVAVTGGVTFGALSWYLVERPFMRLRRLVPRERPQPRDPDFDAADAGLGSPTAASGMVSGDRPAHPPLGSPEGPRPAGS